MAIPLLLILFSVALSRFFVGMVGVGREERMRVNYGKNRCFLNVFRRPLSF